MNPTTMTAAVAVGAAVASTVLVGAARRYALHRRVLDQPTGRSSHRVPTPRGGGIGVVIAVIACLGVAMALGAPSPLRLAVALAAVALVGAVGWLDDHRSLQVGPRLLVHALAGVAVAWLAREVPGPLGMLGAAGAVWWVFWAVSSINVTNFMDGIDGIIGLQAVVFGLHVTLLGRCAGDGALVGAALAGAAAGFLLWNWPPARIFLGDVGSGPLGLLFVIAGVFALDGGRGTVVTAYLPLYPLFFDAAVTLVRRWRRGERLTEAHRSHLYQRLANGGWGHARVTLLYGVAAAVGVVVSRVEQPAMRPLATASYFAAVALAGFVLDRRQAFLEPR